MRMHLLYPHRHCRNLRRLLVRRHHHSWHRHSWHRHRLLRRRLPRHPCIVLTRHWLSWH
jgi:hypothetical protein